MTTTSNPNLAHGLFIESLDAACARGTAPEVFQAQVNELYASNETAVAPRDINRYMTVVLGIAAASLAAHAAFADKAPDPANVPAEAALPVVTAPSVVPSMSGAPIPTLAPSKSPEVPVKPKPSQVAKPVQVPKPVQAPKITPTTVPKVVERSFSNVDFGTVRTYTITNEMLKSGIRTWFAKSEQGPKDFMDEATLNVYNNRPSDQPFKVGDVVKARDCNAAENEVTIKHGTSEERIYRVYTDAGHELSQQKMVALNGGAERKIWPGHCYRIK